MSYASVYIQSLLVQLMHTAQLVLHVHDISHQIVLISACSNAEDLDLYLITFILVTINIFVAFKLITDFLSAFLQNFFLCQDRLSGDVPPHLAQPCYVSLR